MSLYAENKLATMQATAESLGFTVGRNPIFDAICEKEAANAVINAHALLAVSPEESFRQASNSFKGLRVPHDLKARMKAKPGLRTLHDSPLPATYDSRDLGIVPPVRNQASCGSCWDFAAVGAAEIAYCKANGIKADSIDWSEQAVIDCGGTGGCRGDWPETSLHTLKTVGTCDESEDRYRADSGNGRCPAVKLNKIDDYAYVGSDSEVPATEAIKRKVFDHGACAVAAVFDDYACAYGGGIFKATNNNPNGIDHAIIIVGWGDGYWIVRNSWGPSWGEAGYIRMAFGANLIGFGSIHAVVNGAAPVPVPPTPPAPPVPTFNVAIDPITFHTSMLGGNVTIQPKGRLVPLAARPAEKCPCEAPPAVVGFGWEAIIAALIEAFIHSRMKTGSAQFSWRSISWLALLRDVPKLVSDLNAVDVAGAAALAKAMLAAAKAKDIAAIVALWPQVQAALDNPQWLPLLDDAKAILRDLGVTI